MKTRDALALAMDGTILPEKQGGTVAMPKSAMAGLANMLFEDGVGPDVRTDSATANVVSKNPLVGMETACWDKIRLQQRSSDHNKCSKIVPR